MANDSNPIPLPYRLFFLYLEPISALVGAYYAAGKPAEYLAYLSFSSMPTSELPPTSTLISLYQLSNLYLLFALNEHLVLSSTNSIRIWQRLLFCLLMADFGHLATMIPLALEKGFARVFLEFMQWNAMEAGSVGFVYVGALMRISFLAGAGLNQERGKARTDRAD
ncbi:uncharacterized protein LAESUDRAFT_182968 [Laetiporus sulphureus 93-53]|uniref:DUF7704 domain-containing protein n=1 Tax=Laetiporus sulphureus 93-53 TaxID=1314785 RepID=A0A165E9X2_9APHY|nr:uncharacterized protein LAESUDRAFT_182968 [Laetiporus sulphureus 93-53]KZT06557.1 hypothetical protein LAESUDRAFT_182968 [Laetiporus sulphureus 93-53]